MAPSKFINNIDNSVKRGKTVYHILNTAFCTKIPDYAGAFNKFFGDMSKIEGIARAQEVFVTLLFFIIIYLTISTC